MKKLRLLKIVCQPTFVFDDGESLVEHQGQPFQLGSADIDGFAERFWSDLKGLEAELIAQQPPEPNRATRRATAKASTNGK